MAFDRLIRRIVPSVSKITYNPLVKLGLSMFDIVPRLTYREFRKLPPNYMRCRVGVGNRLFANQVIYLTRGSSLWMYAFARGMVDFNSNIVEIGCGCGRRAHHLRDLQFHSEKFTGKYYGIDIDSEMLDWCRRNFDPQRFEFILSTHGSKSYRNEAATSDYYRFPLENNSIDFVFATSLLTHLLEEQMMNYFQESARVLRPGRHLMISCFCLDHPGKTFGDRHTFQHQVGNAYVESKEVPEAAVAYREAFLIESAKKAGFADAHVLHAADDVQQMLVCRK